MPVTLETVSNASAQDLIDLEKIFADYPTDLSWTDLDNQLQKNPALSLYAGRFNDRYLGALSAISGDEGIEIKHLCVRVVTRRRHVARDLLRLFMQANPNQRLIFNHCLDDNPAIKQLFTQAGFSQQGQQFIFQA